MAQWAVSLFFPMISTAFHLRPQYRSSERPYSGDRRCRRNVYPPRRKIAKRIAAEGVDAISVLPPFYYYATQDHLIAYFSDIAAAVDLPVFLYDNPAMTKNNIEPATIATLTEPHSALDGNQGEQSGLRRIFRH